MGSMTTRKRQLVLCNLRVVPECFSSSSDAHSSAISGGSLICFPPATQTRSTAEKIVPYALLGMTAVTGLVDAVGFLSLGRVFTANMTGNIVILAFATARVSGLSIAHSLTALLSFLVGSIFGGRIMARAGADSLIRFAAQALV